MKLPLRKKKSVLDERIRRLQKEISAVREELHVVARETDDTGMPRVAKPPARYHQRQEPLPEEKPPLAPEPAARPQRQSAYERSPEEIKRMYERRFPDYLASSFQQSPALRHERNLQRNKALFMLVFVLLILFLLLRLLW